LTDHQENYTSPEIPFVKDFQFEYGRADDVAPGVSRIICKNPGPFTYTGSGTYLISDRSNGSPCAVIDPGPNDDQHIQNIIGAAGDRGISHILITHTHNDHCGGARLLQEKIGEVPIYGYGPHPISHPVDDAPALDEGADYNFRPDMMIKDREIIKGEGWEIEAVWTPGHISNHLCFGLNQEKILFTGDHIMGWATTVIIPPDGAMNDYFASLDKILTRDDMLYFPTHGAPIKNPQRFARAVRAHRHMRDGQVLYQLSEGVETIAQMVSILYAHVDKRLHMAAGLNVLAHLIGLCEKGKVYCDGSPGLKARYYKVSS